MQIDRCDKYLQIVWCLRDVVYLCARIDAFLGKNTLGGVIRFNYSQ